MKFLLLLFAIIFLFSCSGPENPAEAPASEDATNTQAPAASPAAKAKSPIFDIAACNFLTEAEIKRVLGNKITAISFEEPKVRERRCLRHFTLTLANGNQLRLLFSIEASTVTGVDKEISTFTDTAKEIPRLMKMEAAPDGETYIGTHVSQRRLYLLRSGQETFAALTYDVLHGAEGGKTPEEVEARRQMGISLLHELLAR